MVGYFCSRPACWTFLGLSKLSHYKVVSSAPEGLDLSVFYETAELIIKTEVMSALMAKGLQHLGIEVRREQEA